MGGPASGKSSAINQLIKQGDFVKADPDEIKEQIPQYALAVDKCAKNAAFMAHEESATVADRIARRAVKERKNLIIDGTGKNLPHYLRTIRALRRAGYHVTVIGADVPVSVALKRAKKRGEETGRFVPSSVIRNIYQQVPCNIRPIAEAADEFVLFDTNAKTPRPIVKKERGRGVKVLDPHYLSRLESRCAIPAARPLSGAPRSRKAPAVALAEIIGRIRR